MGLVAPLQQPLPPFAAKVNSAVSTVPSTSTSRIAQDPVGVLIVCTTSTKTFTPPSAPGWTIAVQGGSAAAPLIADVSAGWATMDPAVAQEQPAPAPSHPVSASAVVTTAPAIQRRRSPDMRNPRARPKLTTLASSPAGPIAGRTEGCIVRRMPRMQLYLPEALYEAVKSHRLPASELLQNAVRAEVRRRELLAAGTKYTAELAAEVGRPTAQQRARAGSLAGRIAARSHRKAS